MIGNRFFHLKFGWGIIVDESKKIIVVKFDSDPWCLYSFKKEAIKNDEGTFYLFDD